MPQNKSITDIANALGISKTTVSRAISGNGRVNAATRARVLSYMQENDCAPAAPPRAAAGGKTNNIALVISRQFSTLDLSFLRKSMSAIYEVASQNDYDVILVMTGERETAPMRRLLEAHKIDGAILTRTLENDPLIPLMKEYHLPFVAMGWQRDPEVPQVDNDQIGGCRELTSLLLMKGMHNIALLGGSMLYTVNQSRLEGFRQAYENARIPVNEGLVFLELESEVQRVHALETAVAARPDCILCMDEDVAALVMRTLKAKGIQVPGDVCVASLYDSAELKNMAPTVTAVQFDAVELGYKASRQLLDILSGNAVEHRVELGFQVVMRDSTKSSK